ncbi:MAG: hypothetical protein JWN29_2841, partial [Acidimicrobiales bacterium]|nr:hypothetical protein [Acidimicrobiales bacterium]
MLRSFTGRRPAPRARLALTIAATLALAPLAMVSIPPAASAAAAGTTCIVNEGHQTDSYTVPNDAVGVRAFVAGQAGTQYREFTASEPNRFSYPGGKGANIVTDIPLPGGTTVVMGTIDGGAGGAHYSASVYLHGPPSKGGDASYVARSTSQCNNLLALAAGGGGAGGGGEKVVNDRVVAGSPGGDAGLEGDGSGAQQGRDGGNNTAKDGAGGLGASATAGGGGGNRGTNALSSCSDGNNGGAGGLLRGGNGATGADRSGTNCEGSGGGGGGGAGYYGGGGGGSAFSGWISGGGGGGSSFLAPGTTVVRHALTTDATTSAAPRVVPIFEPTLTITASRTAVPFGETTTFTAHLVNLPAGSGGTVTFMDADTNHNPLPGSSTVDVVNRTATFITDPYTFVYDNHIKAYYSGEQNETAQINRPAATETKILADGHLGALLIHVENQPVPVAVTGTQPYRGTPTFSRTLTTPYGTTLGGSVTCTTADGGTPLAELDAGTHTLDSSSCSGLTLSGTRASTYDFVYTNGTFTVTRPTVQVPVYAYSDFGGAARYYVPNNIGLPSGISAGGEHLSCTLANGSTPPTSLVPGSYRLGNCSGVQLFGTGASNFDVTVVSGYLSVGSADILVMPAGSRVYMGDVDPFTYTTNDLPSGVSVTGTLTCRTVDSGFPTDAMDFSHQRSVGQSSIDSQSCSGLTLAGAAASLYEVRYVGGPFAVRAHPVPVVVSGSQDFGGTTKTFTYPSTPAPDGLTVGGTPTCTKVTGGTAITPTLPIADPPYELDGSSCSGMGLIGFQAQNYVVTYTGTFTVNPPPPITVVVGAMQTYGGTPTFDTYKEIPLGLSVTGSVTCSTVDGGADLEASLPAGFYDIDSDSCSGLALSGANAALYSISYSGQTLIVDTATVTVTAMDAETTYGAGAVTITPSYDGFLVGETDAVLTQEPDCFPVAPGTPGTYPSAGRCYSAEAPNYRFVYVYGTVTVHKRALTITASDGTAEYGAPPPTIAYSAQGFAPLESAYNAFGSYPTCTADTTATTDVGVYENQSSCSGAASANYELIYVSGTVTITGTALVVTAPSPTRVYGAALPTLTPTYDGFAGADSEEVLATPATCSTTATASSPVGTYPVTCSGAAIGGYAISYTAGTLTITRAPLTIIATDGATTYRAGPATVTASYDGFVADDTDAAVTSPTCSSSAPDAAGTYPGAATCQGASAHDYDISYVAGKVTVHKRPLTITASGGTSVYGDALPTITPGYDGFAPADTVENSISTEPICGPGLAPGSSAGVYSDSSSCVGAASDNYAVSYATGTVVITNAAPALATNASSGGPAGTTPVTDTATIAGGVAATGDVTFALYGPGDAACAGPAAFTDTKTVSGNGAYTSAAFTPTRAGTYRWVASYSGDTNNTGATGACGDTDEAVVIAKAGPTFSSTASTGGQVGVTPVSDTATIADGVASTGAVTFKLYGPGDATCAGPAAFTDTRTVSGNGAYTSAPFTPIRAGTYRWVASYSGDIDNTAAAGACGDTDGSVVITKAAPTLSTTASDGGQVGITPVADTATIAGGFAVRGDVIFELYGPGNAACAGPAVFTDTGTVSGNGAYTSASFTPTKAGTYRWAAYYSGDTNNTGVAGACGEGSVVITEPAPTIDTGIDSGPAAGQTTGGSSVRFTYSATGAAAKGFECAVDESAFQACPSAGITLRDLDAGAHTFRVRAVDAAGL